MYSSLSNIMYRNKRLLIAIIIFIIVSKSSFEFLDLQNPFRGKGMGKNFYRIKIIMLKILKQELLKGYTR